MLKTVPLTSSPNNAAQYYYEKKFAEKIETLSNLPNYSDIERFAQKCIDLHCGYGLDAISAQVYMDKINEMTNEFIMKWARSYSNKRMKGK